MSFNQIKDLYEVKRKKVSTYDPFSTGMALGTFGGYMSALPSTRKVPIDAWKKFDEFAGLLSESDFLLFARELTKCASTVAAVYNDPVEKLSYPLTSYQKMEMNNHTRYDHYVTSKAKSEFGPSETLSALAIYNGADNMVYKVGASYHIGVDGLAKINEPIDVAMESGRKIAVNKGFNVPCEPNPFMRDYVRKLNNDEPVPNSMQAVCDKKIVVAGVPVRSIHNAVRSGRIYGDEKGYAGKIEYDPKNNVDFYTSGGDLTYNLHESNGSKRKVTLVESSKFTSVGFDIHGLGATRALSKDVARSLGVIHEKYTDDKGRNDFHDFIVSERKAYKGYFNYSWIIALKALYEKNGEIKNRDRLEFVIGHSKYRYITPGDSDWIIEYDEELVRKVPYTTQILQNGPSVVRKIFGYWNFARVFDPLRKLNNNIRIYEYARIFLENQRISPRAAIYTFVIQAFELLTGEYKAPVVARNMFGMKANVPFVQDLQLDMQVEYREEYLPDAWGTVTPPQKEEAQYDTPYIPPVIESVAVTAVANANSQKKETEPQLRPIGLKEEWLANFTPELMKKENYEYFARNYSELYDLVVPLARGFGTDPYPSYEILGYFTEDLQKICTIEGEPFVAHLMQVSGYANMEWVPPDKSD